MSAWPRSTATFRGGASCSKPSTPTRSNAICAAAGDAAGGTPGEILTAWLYRFATFFTSKHHIAGELLADSDNSNRNAIFSQSRARVLAAGRPLLAAAQRSHEVRDNLTLEQILDMVIAIAAINGGPGYSQPILRGAAHGQACLLAPAPAPPPPPPPPPPPFFYGLAAGLRHVVAAQVGRVDPDPHDRLGRRVAEPLRGRHPAGVWLGPLRVPPPLPRPAGPGRGQPG